MLVESYLMLYGLKIKYLTVTIFTERGTECLHL